MKHLYQLFFFNKELNTYMAVGKDCDYSAFVVCVKFCYSLPCLRRCFLPDSFIWWEITCDGNSVITSWCLINVLMFLAMWTKDSGTNLNRKIQYKKDLFQDVQELQPLFKIAF